MKLKRILCSVFALFLFLSAFLLAPSAAGSPAAPNASQVLVDGRELAFEAYTIQGNNYFKLRDIARALSGTSKEFEVTWDGARNAILLISDRAYTALGDEMSGNSSGMQLAVPTDARIYLDGCEVTLTAYTIAGHNYFKLRDIAAWLNFGVVWDGASNTIAISSDVGYALSELR